MNGVYLAYPIDQARMGPVDGVAEALDWARDEGLWVYNPGLAFHAAGCTPSPGIRAINGAALDQADVVIAFLPEGVPSIGVPMEIDRAVLAGKTVIVVSSTASWMLQYDAPNVLVVPEWDDSVVHSWFRPTVGVVSDRRSRLPVVVDEGAEEPRRGYEDDAGLDLVVSEDRWVEPGEFVDIPCGIRVELPEWSWGLITGRSSTLRKRGLMVNQGVIDAGYRGPLFAGVWNLTSTPAEVKTGERVAQLLIMHNGTREVEVQRVGALSPGSRGEAGFGSTGS